MKFNQISAPVFIKQLFQFSLVVLTLGLMSSSALADDYAFKVENKTKSRIVKVMVSENGKKYAEFDIGKGIAPGKTVTLVWAEHTNDQACKQYVKAVYADGEESEPAKFDFCEEDLEIEFED